MVQGRLCGAKRFLSHDKRHDTDGVCLLTRCPGAANPGARRLINQAQPSPDRAAGARFLLVLSLLPFACPCFGVATNSFPFATFASVPFLPRHTLSLTRWERLSFPHTLEVTARFSSLKHPFLRRKRSKKTKASFSHSTKGCRVLSFPAHVSPQCMALALERCSTSVPPPLLLVDRLSRKCFPRTSVLPVCLGHTGERPTATSRTHGMSRLIACKLRALR